MTILNHIEGSITLTSPLHCASGSEKSTTYTAKQPVVGPNGTNQVPYFPANDLRGRLRRKAAKILVDHLTGSGGKISIELLSGLTCGAISANGESDVSVEEVLRARANVYMGVFGGGTRLMRSGAQIHDMLPFVAETVEAGMVPEYLGVEIPMDSRAGGKDASGNNVAAPLRAWQLLHKFQTVRVDDTYRVTNLMLAEQALADPQKEIAEYQASCISDNAKRKEDKEKNKKTTLANVMEAEAIASGTRLHLRIDLDDHLTDAQRGLVLLALRDLCNEQALGGMVRHGWGRFSANILGKFDGNNVDDNGAPLPVMGLDKDTGLYQLTGLAANYADSAMAEIEALTIDDMWAFFKPVKEAA